MDAEKLLSRIGATTEELPVIHVILVQSDGTQKSLVPYFVKHTFLHSKNGKVDTLNIHIEKWDE